MTVVGGHAWKRRRAWSESGHIDPCIIQRWLRLRRYGGSGPVEVWLLGDPKHHLEHAGVPAASLRQCRADAAQDVRAIREHVTRFFQIAAAQVLEHSRKEIGQFVSREPQARALV